VLVPTRRNNGIPMLSIIIITKNESRHIGRCLSSVSWADEIIVFDCGSDDNTIDICRAYTNKIFITEDWPGFGVQKQRALEKATSDWVLSIDADEQVTPELRTEIEQVIRNNQFSGYRILRISSYCGRNIKYGDWRSDFVLRLFKRVAGKFSPDLVHEQIIVAGALAQLTQPLLHETFINLAEMLCKLNDYSSLSARKLHAVGKKTSILEAIFRGIWTFIRGYFLKAGFLDGRYGLMLAISNAEGTYYKYVKLLEMGSNLEL
jgi:glycosyltransferase involved in cell wall biosynthesis